MNVGQPTKDSDFIFYISFWISNGNAKGIVNLIRFCTSDCDLLSTFPPKFKTDNNWNPRVVAD